MKVVSLTVYDESASCEFLLPDYGRGVLNKLRQNSIIVVHNGATILNSQNNIILTIASQKYGQVQVYNPLDESNAGGEFDAEYSDIVMGFCEDLTQN